MVATPRQYARPEATASGSRASVVGGSACLERRLRRQGRTRWLASYQSRRDARAAVAEETTDKTPGCFSTRSSMSPRGGLDGRGASDAATASEAAMALGEWRERSRREARRPSAEEAREREQKRRRANREGGGNAARNARVARGIRPWPRARRTRALCTCGSATMARVARGGFISRICRSRAASPFM